MTTEDIKTALLKGERINLECKSAMNGLPKSVWESYSAFANTLGGIILLGVEEHRNEVDTQKRFTINGVENAQKIEEDFWNTVNSNKVSANIMLNDDVDIVSIDGKDVVCIQVPQADWRMKPVYLNDNIYKGSYKRNHEGDFHCTESEVRTMIRDANEEGNDGALMEGFTMDDVDMDSLRRYRNAFRNVNIEHPWNDIDDKTFLTNLKGYVVDRNSSKEGLTAAGLMMFGKGLSIVDRFSNFRMDYLDMSNLIGDERYKYRLTYDGRWENNLYQFFNIILPKITFDMPRPFRLEEGLQRIDDTPQIAAVREALTNSIIHCDFFGAAGILRIEKHDNKFVFRNPGTLLIPREKVFEGGNSKARNPRIQTLLRMIGFGENIGSGFPKILHAWKEAGWQTPTLDNDLDTNEVKVTLFIPEVKESEQKSEQKSKQKSEQRVLSKTEYLILEIIRSVPNITRAELAVRTNKSSSMVYKYLTKLKETGLIRRVGPDKGGHWEVI